MCALLFFFFFFFFFFAYGQIEPDSIYQCARGLSRVFGGLNAIDLFANCPRTNRRTHEVIIGNFRKSILHLLESVNFYAGREILAK